MDITAEFFNIDFEQTLVDMYHKYLKLLVLFIFGSASLYSQPRKDSLRSIWKNETLKDSVRLEALKVFAQDYYVNVNPDSAIILYTQGISMARDGEFTKLESFLLNGKSNAYMLLGKLDSAMNCIEKSIELREEMGDSILIANGLTSLANIYIQYGKYESAIGIYKKVIPLRKAAGGLDKLANALNNIGIIYFHLGDFYRCIDYYSQSAAIEEEMGDMEGVATTMMNIGITYTSIKDPTSALKYLLIADSLLQKSANLERKKILCATLGATYSGLGEFTKAIEYYEKTSNYAQQMNDSSRIARVLMDMGVIWGRSGDHSKALEYYQDSRNLFQLIHRKNNLKLPEIETNEAYSLLQLGRYNDAINKGKRALTHRNLSLAFKVELLNTLYSAYYQKGQYQESLEMLERHISLKDSLASESNQKALHQLEAKYTYAKQAIADSLQNAAHLKQVDLEHQVAIAQAETERNLYASGGLVLLLVTFFFFQRKVNLNKLLLKEKETDYQREVLYATINSQEIERRRIARDLHDEVGAMLSTIKLNLGTVEMQLKQAGLSEQLTSPARNLVDETINNVRGISKNLLPPTLEEFGLAHALTDLADKVEEASGILFKKDIQPLSKRLPIEHELALFRVIQEMINNAIKHAEATEFTLNMCEQSGQLNLSFADNGKGFDFEAIKQSNSGKTGLGLKNLENRVGVAGGEMEFITTPGKGTELNVWVPLAKQYERAA